MVAVTHEPAEDYLSRTETESWTWRVEDSWGDGVASSSSATNVPASEPEPDGEVESGEYLGADPLDADWARTWYDAGDGSEEGANTPAKRPESPQLTASATGSPMGGPLTSLSLTPLSRTWDEDDEALMVKQPRLQQFWEEKGKKVAVPAALALLIVLGIVLMVLNVMWAAEA